MRSLRRVWIGLFVVFLVVPSTKAYSLTIDFESLLDFEDLTSQYASLGVTFSNTTALTAGISLNESEFPPLSGSNVVFDNGGAMSILFDFAVDSVGGYFTYVGPLTFVAYDTTNAIVGSATSVFDSNLALSGTSGSTPNEFLQLAFASGINRIIITGDPAGGSFTLDDLIFTTMTTAVTEPVTLVLFFVGGVMLLLVRRGRRKAVSTHHTVATA